MKTVILIMLFVFISNVNYAQNLSEIYKKDIINLVPEADYAVNNNWDRIFESYYDTTFYGKEIGKRKSLIVLDDGSVLVNNIYRNFYTKFNSDGKFVKELYIKRGDKGIIKKTQPIFGVLNNEFYTGADNMGNIICADLEGNYIKSLKLNYSVKQIITLSNNKLAVLGWSIWKDKFRDFVAIVDYKTQKQKIIWEHFTDRNSEKKKRFTYKYTLEADEGNKQSSDYVISVTTMPFTKITGYSIPPIINTVGNKLIVAIPISGKILIFDNEGNKLSSKTIDWAKNYISIDEQKEIQRKAIAKYKALRDKKLHDIHTSDANKKAISALVKEMEDDLEAINKPLAIPVFSTIIKDSDDNLLFFEIPKKNGDNKFNVWILKNSGEFSNQCSFVCKDYNLDINPKRMVFHKGYIYSLQTKKNVNGNPLRLVKFKLL